MVICAQCARGLPCNCRNKTGDSLRKRLFRAAIADYEHEMKTTVEEIVAERRRRIRLAEDARLRIL